jgi:trimeric autotransporter adhesin
MLLKWVLAKAMFAITKNTSIMKKIFVFANFVLVCILLHPCTGRAQTWSLNGNAGTHSGTHFIGTTDTAALVFKVNKSRSGLIEAGSAGGNTAFGYSALSLNAGGAFNTVTGYVSMLNNTTGSYNTANGYKALLYNLSGNNNTATGSEALRLNRTGSHNTATGIGAMYHNDNGQANAASGGEALYSNLIGNFNTANGYKALHENTSGVDNTAVGAIALFANTTGGYNTAQGFAAMNNNTTGSNNTSLGSYALYGNNTGSNSTAIGYKSAQFGNYTNATSLGANASAGASNTVRIGDNLIISIGGAVGWTNYSDGRIKRNIQENVPGLAFINKLKPVTYHLDIAAADRIMGVAPAKDDQGRIIPASFEAVAARTVKEAALQTGFVAQQVEAAAKEMGYEFSGVDAAKNEHDLYGIRYAEFVAPLVKAVQELSAQSEQLRKELDALKLAIAKTQHVTAVETLPNRLRQNQPNPADQYATIQYSVAATARQAQLRLTDASGKLLQQYVLATGTNSSVRIHTAAMTSGVYVYSLVVDGKVVESVKLVVGR